MAARDQRRAQHRKSHSDQIRALKAQVKQLEGEYRAAIEGNKYKGISRKEISPSKKKKKPRSLEQYKMIKLMNEQSLPIRHLGSGPPLRHVPTITVSCNNQMSPSFNPNFIDLSHRIF